MSTMTRPAPPAGAALLLGRVRRRWTRAAWLRGLLWVAALIATVALLLVALDVAWPLSAAVRLAARWLPAAVLVGASLSVAGRVRRAGQADRVALLAQERSPALQNRLATALEIDRAPPGVVRDAFLAELERTLERLPAPSSTHRPLRLPAGIAAGALAALALGALLFPGAAAEAVERWAHPRDAYPQAWRERRAEAARRVAQLPPPPFAELRWTVHPPAYSGLPAVSGRGEEPVLALAGSRLEVRSHFSARWDAVRVARADGARLQVGRSGDEWSVQAVVRPEERGFSAEALSAGAVVARRTLPVTVRPDAPPDVRLEAPAADLVLATASGRIAVSAQASDDLGVATLHLSWSRTRGSGETFEYVDGEWPLDGVRPGRRATGSRTLDLAALGLQPGDVMHLRAVARDRNDVTGPGESVSGTRTIRIARPDELDQVNTDVGFPIELPENPLLSQRMIVIRTERLRDRARALGPVEVRRQAAALAVEQARLRERVGEQVFTRATEAVQDPFADLSFTETGGQAHAHAEQPAAAPEGPEQVLEEASEATGQGTMDEVAHRHDSAPILEINRTLQRIYDLMWGSERALHQAEPVAALPHQYEALRLIQELRRTERRFPRGSIQVDALDVAAARGTGKLEDVAPAARTAGTPLPDAAAALAELERVGAALPAQTPQAASLALAGLAQRLLATPGVDPATVSLVERAAEAATRGGPTAAGEWLARARQRLAPGAGAQRRATERARDPAGAEYFRRLGRTP